MATPKSIGTLIQDAQGLTVYAEDLTLTDENRRALQAMRSGERIGKMAESKRFAEFSAALRQMASLVGCPLPTGEQDFRKAVARAAKFAVTFYPGMTISEMLLAFELFAAGRLNGQFQKGLYGGRELPNHFGQMSPKYIGEVLNAYTAVRDRATYVANRLRPGAPTPISEEEKRANDLRLRLELADQYESFLRSGRIEFATFATAIVWKQILEKRDAFVPAATAKKGVIESFKALRSRGADIRSLLSL